MSQENQEIIGLPNTSAFLNRYLASLKHVEQESRQKITTYSYQYNTTFNRPDYKRELEVLDSIFVLSVMINRVEIIIKLLQNFNTHLSEEQLVEFDTIINAQTLLFNNNQLSKTSDENTPTFNYKRIAEQINDLPTSGSYLVFSIYEKAKTHLEIGDKRGYRKNLIFILDYLQYVFACFYIPLVICPILFATTGLGWMVLIPLIIGSVFFLSWCIAGLVSLEQKNSNRNRILTDHIHPAENDFKLPFKYHFTNDVNNNASEFKETTVYHLADKDGDDTFCVIDNSKDGISIKKTVNNETSLRLFSKFKEKGDDITLSEKVDKHCKSIPQNSK